MNELNVWKNTWRPARCIIANVRLLCRKVKWSYQRVVRGFSDYDAYDLDSYYSALIRDSLRHFADVTHTYPGRDPYDTPKSWRVKVLEIADRFDYYVTDIANPLRTEIEYGNRNEEIVKKFLDEEMTIAEQKHKAIVSGLRELADVWEDLWD